MPSKYIKIMMNKQRDGQLEQKWRVEGIYSFSVVSDLPNNFNVYTIFKYLRKRLLTATDVNFSFN